MTPVVTRAVGYPGKVHSQVMAGDRTLELFRVFKQATRFFGGKGLRRSKTGKERKNDDEE
jgi:hypothetical protein